MTGEERVKLLSVRSKLRGWPDDVIANWRTISTRKIRGIDRQGSSSDYMDQWEKWLGSLPDDYKW